MSISEYIKTKEYVVTVHNHCDLDKLYHDLETENASPENTEIVRPVHCVSRRPNSRATIYKLTRWEAEELKKNPLVKSVNISPKEYGAQPEPFFVNQSSDFWNKSTLTSSTMKNWGLLRCSEEIQRANWGSDGTQDQSATIVLAQTGKNVDVVIVDGGDIVSNHPEFAANSDGTGGSRVISYNWYQHQGVVGGSGGSTYSSEIDSHATHVAGTVAGNTQGWARSANIYTLSFLAGGGPPVFGYLREFHRNKPINSNTGKKNPTICNNSWGYVVPATSWSFEDITAVNFRGVRYVPSGDPVFLGASGVYTAGAKVANLLGLENFGNRITTGGSYDPPGGELISWPGSWVNEGRQVYIFGVSTPEPSYTVTVQGPLSMFLINNVAAGSFTGIVSVYAEVIIRDGDTVVQSFTSGPFVSTEGGDVEADIAENITLLGDSVYTIEFNTTVDVSQTSGPLVAFLMTLTVEEDTVGNPTADVTEIPNSILGTEGLSMISTPSFGNNDDGYWTISLPFDIEYFGTNYNIVNIGTNSYLTFGGGATVYTGIRDDTPNLPKIMWCAGDRSVQRVYHGVSGTAPDRTYRIRVEGHQSAFGAIVGVPTMLCEYTFYENTPFQIDLQCGVNEAKSIAGTFPPEQLNSFGLIEGERIQYRYPEIDQDIEDAIDEGIIFVGAAGNYYNKIASPGDLDWDNYFEMAFREPSTLNEPIYYMRGATPTANDNTVGGTYDIPNITVGATGDLQIERKASFSNCGPGVDIWSPGVRVISADIAGADDPRNSSFKISKKSGTSMASPQVCGVLACALEIYPSMKQEEAKSYILSYGKLDQLNSTSGGTLDVRDLQGAPNLFLYYYKERQTSGNIFPKINYKPRPSSGSVFPRPRIRRTV